MPWATRSIRRCRSLGLMEQIERLVHLFGQLVDGREDLRDPRALLADRRRNLTNSAARDMDDRELAQLFTRGLELFEPLMNAASPRSLTLPLHECRR